MILTAAMLLLQGDFSNGNVVLGYTAHDANGYAGKDKNFVSMAELRV